MPSYKHKSSRRRTAQAETARTQQRKIRRQAETTGDPYLDTVYDQLHNVRKLYHLFASKKPVMLYDIQEQKVYAYPYREFKADLSERSQALLEEQYRRAVAEGKMVVFVRDNDLRRLVSYALDIE